LAETSPAPSFSFETSRYFVNWLQEVGASLGFSTYQIGKVFLVGSRPNGRFSIYERTFNHSMGMTASANGFYLASLYQLWRFENILPEGATHDDYDALYVPQIGWTTGDVDTHDIALDADARPVFVNTLFSCLATISETASFKPIWQPPFISRLAPEDRCHLNGLAMKDGQPYMVTATSRSDVADGWRERRADGGCVVDVASGEIVAAGLSMPHSPRFHRGKLWLHNSGSGEFGTIDTETGRFEPVAFSPGFLRGLDFIGKYAVVGLSLPRYRRFSGLAIDAELERRDAAPQCGIQVIDLETGHIPHWLRADGFIEELYDVIVLPETRRPMLLGFQSDEIRTRLSIEE
jgi:uncharacterized protein (TIGR03032 family)